MVLQNVTMGMGLCKAYMGSLCYFLVFHVNILFPYYIFNDCRIYSDTLYFISDINDLYIITLFLPVFIEVYQFYLLIFPKEPDL